MQVPESWMSCFQSPGKRIRLSDFSWGNICCSCELIAGFWLHSALNHSVLRRIWSGYFLIEILTQAPSHKGLKGEKTFQKFHTFHSCLSCLQSGDFLVAGVFQHSTIWRGVPLAAVRIPVWYTRGGTILLGLHAPCFKIYLILILYEAGEQTSSLLNVCLLLQNKSICYVLQLKEALQQNVLVTGRGQAYHYPVGTAVRIMNG